MAEREGESGIDTVVLLFVSDGSGKDFRCRSQNGKKPTVIRWQDKEQESTKMRLGEGRQHVECQLGRVITRLGCLSRGGCEM